MTTVIALLLVGGLVVYAFSAYQRQAIHFSASVPEVLAPPEVRTPAPQAVDTAFRCDGRTSCPQMTSCDEATFFLRNCPGVKMDGNGDGVPCQQQWCPGK